MQRVHFCFECELELTVEEWARVSRDSFGYATEGRCDSCEEAYADGYDPGAGSGSRVTLVSDLSEAYGNSYKNPAYVDRVISSLDGAWG